MTTVRTSARLAFILLAIILVDLAVGLPTIYTEAEDYSYRTKPCTNSPTPASLQQVVNSASPGDIICLQPGVVYSEIVINSPQGSNNDYITIRNANLSLLPPPGVRVSPLYAPYLPLLDGGITVTEGSRYRFVGLYLAGLQNVSYYSMLATSSTSDHIIMDQCYTKYVEGATGYFTFILIGTHMAMMNSYIEDRSYGTSLVDCSVLKVTNNYFDNAYKFFSTGEVAQFGSDFEIRFNYFQKYGEYVPLQTSSPNLLSRTVNYVGLTFNIGFRRIWIDSNYIAPSNPDAGVLSTAIGTRSMDDFVVTNNYFDTCDLAFALEDKAAYTPTSSIVVYGNFMADVTNRPFYLIAGMAEYNISQNTIIGDPYVMNSFISLFLENATDVSMIIQQNIASGGVYGIPVTLSDRIFNLLPADRLTWNDNVIVGDPYMHPAFPSVGTIFENSFDNISFVNPSRRDYQLLSTSPYYKGNYGKQMGVDLCSLVRSAKLKFVLANCSLTDVLIQPTEILIITDVLIVNGNLTMFPDSVLKVDGVNVLNITSCAQFDGTLDLLNVNELINQTIVVAYYSCWSGGEFKDVSYNDQTSDGCNKLKVELSYQPTLVTATIVLENQCQTTTPSGQVIGPSAIGNNNNPSSPLGAGNENIISDPSLPTWFLPVVIVGGAVFLTLLFIILAVSIPSLKQRVFHKKRRYVSSMEMSQQDKD